MKPVAPRPAPLLLAPMLALAPFSAFAETIADSPAYARFQDAFADLCFWEDTPPSAEHFPSESWELEWTFPSSDAVETATLYKFFCGAGAYNVNSVYYLDTGTEGPLPVAFASPSFEIAYESDDFEAAVEAITVTGMRTRYLLVNSDFDPESRTIGEFVRWRGISDASASGTWAFLEGEFILKTYDVDASYDREINPERVVDFRRRGA